MAAKDFCAIRNKYYNKLAENIGKDSAHAWFRQNLANPRSMEEVEAITKNFEEKKQARENLTNAEIVEATTRMLKNSRENQFLPSKDADHYLLRSEPDKIFYRVSAVYEAMKREKDRHYKGEDDSFYAKKGTVIHKYMEFILKDIFAGKAPGHLDIVQRVKEELQTHPEFKEESHKFFDVNPHQFKLLSAAARDMQSSLLELQKEIDPNGKIESFFEQPVNDPMHDRGGTIDFMVLFSDGSAAIYDFKTFTKGDRGPNNKQLDEWHFKMMNYANMLKNNYGVKVIRQNRVIPISVNYQNKDSFSSEYGSRIIDGFRKIAISTRENDIKHLRPIPVEERSGIAALDDMIVKMERRISELKMRKGKAKTRSEVIQLGQSILSLETAYRDLLVSTDLSTTSHNIREIMRRYKKRAYIPEYEDGHMDVKELLDAYHELEIYETMPTAFSSKVETIKDPDRREELSAKITTTAKEVTDIRNAIFEIMRDRVGGESLESTGQGITSIGKMFHGLENWQIPAFQQFNVFYTNATERARLDTERQEAKIDKIDGEFHKWADSQGLGKLERFRLMYNDKTGKLYEEYTEDLYREFHTLTERYRQALNKEQFPDAKPLTAAERAWLADNFEVNEQAVQRAEDTMKADIEHQVEIGKFPKAEADKRMTIFYKESDPRKSKKAFFRGNSINRQEDFLVPSKKAAQYHSPEYLNIQNNAPLKAYYDMFTGYIQEYREHYGRSVIGKNFVPIVHKGMTETIAETGIGAVSDIFKTHYQKFKIREQDETMGSINKATGEYVKTIPLLFVEPLSANELNSDETAKIASEAATFFDPATLAYEAEVKRLTEQRRRELGVEQQSVDLTRNLRMFLRVANDHIQISNMEPMIKGVLTVLSSDKMKHAQQDRNDKTMFNKLVMDIVEKSGVPTDIIESYEMFMDRLVYKKRFTKEILALEKYSANKIISSMMNFFSAVAIGANITLVASNYLTARHNLWMLSKENRYFAPEDWNRSMKWFATHDQRFADVYDYVQPTTRNYLQERADRSSATTLGKALRTRYLFIGHIFGDDRIDTALSVAMSLRYKVDSDGRIKNPEFTELLNKDAPTVADAIQRDEDGMAYISGVTVEEHGKYRSKVRKMGQRVKGMTNEKQKGLINSYMMGAMVTHLRSWMTGMATRRFGRLEYDYVLETVEQGTFSVAVGELLGNGAIPAMKEFSKMAMETVSMGLYTREINYEAAQKRLKEEQGRNELLKDMNVEQFVKFKRAKMNAVTAELRVYLAFIALVSLLKAREWDDEESENIFTYSGHRMAQRALLEISFWLSPNASMDILRSPIPLFGLIGRLTRMTENAVVQSAHAIRGVDDPRQKAFPFYYFLRTAPGINQVLDILGVFETYNQPKSVIQRAFFKDEEDE